MNIIKYLTQITKKNLRVFLQQVVFYFIVLVLSYFFALTIFNYLRDLSDKTTKLNHKIMYDTFSNILFYIIITSGVFFVLVKLGFNLNTILVVLGSVGLAIALALQESITNVTAGFMILFLEYYDKGDLVEIDGIVGYVESFNLFNTTIKNLDKITITFPNKEIVGKPLTNFYKSETAQVSFLINVSNYDKTVNINEISDKIVKSLRDNCKYVIDKNDVRVTVSDLSNAGTVLKVKFAIESKNYISAKNDSQKIVRDTIKDSNIFLLDYYYSDKDKDKEDADKPKK